MEPAANTIYMCVWMRASALFLCEQILNPHWTHGAAMNENNNNNQV